MLECNGVQDRVCNTAMGPYQRRAESANAKWGISPSGRDDRV